MKSMHLCGLLFVEFDGENPVSKFQQEQSRGPKMVKKFRMTKTRQPGYYVTGDRHQKFEELLNSLEFDQA